VGTGHDNFNVGSAHPVSKSSGGEISHWPEGFPKRRNGWLSLVTQLEDTFATTQSPEGPSKGGKLHCSSPHQW